MKISAHTSIILTQNDTIKALYSARSALFSSHQHVKKQDASSSNGGGGDDDGVDLSEKRTAGPSIYHNTSLRLHLQNQSHPLPIDVRIIELSLGFSCFSSRLLQTLVIVLYFTLTPFTTKDILMCICVNILPDSCQGDREMLTPAPGMIDH